MFEEGNMTTPDASSVYVSDDERVVLPRERDVGRVTEWELRSGDDVLHVTAQFLGMGTSYSDTHRHPGHAYADLNVRCRACRWFEPRIFREVGGQRRYLVHRTGRSVVPGEVSFTSHEWVHGAYEVIEALTTRRANGHGRTMPPYLTHPAARVLAQAASHDDDLAQAYVDRAVA